jgi:hypothetical protein
MWAKCRGLGGAHRESEGGVWPARPPREHWEPMGLVANVVRMTGVAGRCTTSSLCRRMWTRAWTKAWTRGRGSLQMMRGLGSGHVRGACVAWRPRGSEAWRVCRRACANMLLQQTTRHERGARDVSVAGELPALAPRYARNFFRGTRFAFVRRREVQRRNRRPSRTHLRAVGARWAGQATSWDFRS